MKPDDQAVAPEDTLALLLESYDAALATGRPAECTADDDMSAVMRAELEGLQACLRRLERAWPRRGRLRSGPADNPELPESLLHENPARLGRFPEQSSPGVWRWGALCGNAIRPEYVSARLIDSFPSPAQSLGRGLLS
jgi:hypothetical protein